MKTLYVSDLDGTLLNSEQTTSKYTNETINKLAEKGVLFSYATARSWATAHLAASGISAKIPLVVYNGTFIVDNVTGERIVSNYFDKEIINVIHDI